MARARFEKLPAEKQEAILAAAAEEFAARGYEAASLNRIIERAGSSKGSLYYYFEDKADLLRTAMERALARALREVEFPALADLTAERFWERVRAVALASLPQMEADTWYMRLMRSFYRLREEAAAREATSAVLEESRGFVVAFLERGRQLGVVRTDVPLDLLVEIYLAADQAGDRWMLRHWDTWTQQEKREVFEARLDLVRDMLDAQHAGWGR